MHSFTCDLSQRAAAFDHYWEHTVGSGHAPLALRADWQAQLQKCHAELGVRHVRFHGLLSEPMGTLICQNDELLYSFFNADQIMDFLLSIGMKPFVELSFMPDTLASGSDTVFRYRGNVTLPKDYAQWAALIRELVGHWVERYGTREVSRWFFEVWNEPNLQAFWRGTQQDYFKLYRHTAETIKAIDASLKVGGPATAQSAWVDDFVSFCEGHGIPADFITTHYYPTDAFGQITMDTLTQLANAPRDVMRERAREVHQQARGRPVYYTEWNISSNPRDPLHDAPFAAAYAVHIVMSVREFVRGYSFWTFSDIFEENYFPSLPFHGGFGLVNLHGVPKPVYRAFELLHHLGDEILTVTGKHQTVEAWGTRKADTLTMLLINHAQPRHSISTQAIHMRLMNAPRVDPLSVRVERIDEEHANPRQAWYELGKPKYLNEGQLSELVSASQLNPELLPYQRVRNDLAFDLHLPAHAVAAVTCEFAPGSLKAGARA